MFAKTFYLFRHGQTDWNAQDRAQGQTNVPLNSVGIEQAKRLQKAIQHLNLDRIVSSDLDRAHQTAIHASLGSDIPLQLDPRLRETNMGEFEGTFYSEIISRLGPDFLVRWRSGRTEDQDLRFPGGESSKEVIGRVNEALFELCRSTPGDLAIGISTHGGVMRRLMELYYPTHLPRTLVPNGTLFALRFDPESSPSWQFTQWFELRR